MTAKQLKAARTTLGVTQYILAQYLDVSRGAYNHWEQGNAAVPTEIAEAMSEAVHHAKEMQQCLARGGERYRKWKWG